ncbi:hypothetical protein [Pendulispora albinea]|uniref:Tryptophan synthase alpha chain n=1 Tax=Pendulispora albinea TaxID=2741071 RepID=A0ABZ2M581_9BACT
MIDSGREAGCYVRMRAGRWRWFAGGAVALAAAGIELAACSEGGTGFPTRHDASRADARFGDGGGDDAGSEDDAGLDAPVDCGAPLVLRPSPAAGTYCTFMADGGRRSCALGEHCCVYPTNARLDSTCNPAGVACEAPVDAGGADFECDESSDCTDPSRPTCCLDGVPVTSATCPLNGFISGIRRTYCSAEPACGVAVRDAGAIVCGTNPECEAGVCAPVSTKGKTIGVCLR